MERKFAALTPSASGTFFAPDVDASPVWRSGDGRPGRVKRGRIIKRKKKKARRLNYTEELDMLVPLEPNHPNEAKWKSKKLVYSAS